MTTCETLACCGSSVVLDDDWKPVSIVGDAREFYRLDFDSTEMKAIATAQSARVRLMSNAWHPWAKRPCVELTCDLFEAAEAPAGMRQKHP